MGQNCTVEQSALEMDSRSMNMYIFEEAVLSRRIPCTGCVLTLPPPRIWDTLCLRERLSYKCCRLVPGAVPRTGHSSERKRGNGQNEWAYESIPVYNMLGRTQISVKQLSGTSH